MPKNLRYPAETILNVSRTTFASAMSNVAGLMKFGWDEPALTAFNAKIQSATALLSGEANIDALKGKTMDKNLALEKGFIWLTDTRVRVRKVFKKNTTQYASFPFDRIDESKGSELLMKPLLEEVVGFTQTNITELTPAGHTAEVQAEGLALLDELTDKDTTQEIKKQTNKSETQNRYEVFEELVKTVNQINAAGRKAFRNDPVKKVLFNSIWPRRTAKTPKPPAPPAP